MKKGIAQLRKEVGTLCVILGFKEQPFHAFDKTRGWGNDGLCFKMELWL